MDVAKHACRGAVESEIAATVCRLLHLDSGAIDLEQPLLAAGMTSIELIELITRVEHRYRIEFPLDKIKNISVRSLVDAVNRQIGERS